MALKVKSSDTNESSNDEDSKMKSYITRKFKKFMKNANAKGFDKDRRQSSSSQSRVMRKETLHKYISMGQKSDLKI